MVCTDYVNMLYCQWISRIFLDIIQIHCGMLTGERRAPDKKNHVENRMDQLWEKKNE